MNSAVIVPQIQADGYNRTTLLFTNCSAVLPVAENAITNPDNTKKIGTPTHPDEKIDPNRLNSIAKAAGAELVLCQPK
jgi:hypothetical protein